MKTQEVIELRGHHLLKLWEYVDVLNKYSGYLPEAGGYTCPDWERTYIKSEINAFAYTPEQNLMFRTNLFRILHEPNLQVRVTDSHDCVCKDCDHKFHPHFPKKLNPVCESAPAYDRETLERFGLEVGKVYSAREICDKVLDNPNPKVRERGWQGKYSRETMRVMEELAIPF